MDHSFLGLKFCTLIEYGYKLELCLQACNDIFNWEISNEQLKLPRLGRGIWGSKLQREGVENSVEVQWMKRSVYFI